MRPQNEVLGREAMIVRSLVLACLATLGPNLVSANEPVSNLRFDRDTVIVWTSENRGLKYDFVIRIAVFGPNRFFEWESTANQGTVLLSREALDSSKEFYASKLFDPGVDVRGSGATCIWLSRQLYQDLVTRGLAKLKLDGIEGKMTLVGREMIEAEINQKSGSLPAIIVEDSRGGQWWFLDDADNPLMLKYKLREYTQKIKSITTNRKNMLRWIKDSKIKAVN